MPENVNTSSLAAAVEDLSEDNRQTMVKVDHVSMIFNMASEQLNSLKEYAIQIARRKLFFEGFTALDDVSFEVKKGDVFGIIGTNGSGKSTMLKIIAGVLEPTKGTCEINGNIAPLIELGAGFDTELSARENIYLNGALLGYSTEDLRLNTGLLDTFLPLIKAHYLDFIDRFEADPAEALHPVCAPFIQPEDYSWCIHVDEQMVERYGTPEQLAEYRHQAELRGTPERKAKNWIGSMLFHFSHANDVDQAWASSRTREELDQVVEPFVQAKRQTGQWTQEDEAGYQLYQQETDPKKRTFRVWYLIANPRGLPKEFVQKELEFRWKLFANREEERK